MIDTFDTLNIEDIDFSGFTQRKEDLSNVRRYNMYPTMYYRSSIYEHSRRVFHLLKAAIPYLFEIYGNKLNYNRMLITTLVHDDPEIVTGDIQSGRKAKMTKRELDILKRKELKAIHTLADRYPEHIAGFNYRELVVEIFKKKTLESQIIKFIDHFDALGEAMHEIYAGNNVFNTHLIDKEFGKIEKPHEYYFKRFNDYKNNYPLLAKLIGGNLPFLGYYEYIDGDSVIANGSLHTLESLKTPIGPEYYQRRKEVMMKSLNAEELPYLYTQKEFPKIDKQ